MRRGFTLLEVLLAALILGLGLTGILVAMSQAQKTMLGSTYLETAQEVMDIGDMAYPLSDVKDPEMDLDVQETKVDELWERISDVRLSSAQEEKFHGYTWEREWINKHEDEEIEKDVPAEEQAEPPAEQEAAAKPSDAAKGEEPKTKAEDAPAAATKPQDETAAAPEKDVEDQMSAAGNNQGETM